MDRGATDRKKAHKEDKTKQSKSISLQMGDKERGGTTDQKKGEEPALHVEARKGHTK